MTYSTAEGREPRFVVSEGDSHLKKDWNDVDDDGKDDADHEDIDDHVHGKA